MQPNNIESFRVESIVVHRYIKHSKPAAPLHCMRNPVGVSLYGGGPCGSINLRSLLSNKPIFS